MRIVDVKQRQKMIRERETEIKETLQICTDPSRDALAAADTILELAQELIDLRAEYCYLGKLHKAGVDQVSQRVIDNRK